MFIDLSTKKSLEFGVLCLFNGRLVSERTFGVKYDSYTRIKLHIMYIIIKYYRHI